MTTYTTTNETIKLKLPVTYAYYKKIAGEMNENNMSEIQINTIFKQMITDFRSGKLSVDDISAICGVLFDRVVKFKNRDRNHLFDAINAGSELGFYVRNPKLSSQFNSFLKEVLDYADSVAEI